MIVSALTVNNKPIDCTSPVADLHSMDSGLRKVSSGPRSIWDLRQECLCCFIFFRLCQFHSADALLYRLP